MMLRLRAMTDDEQTQITRWSRSRTESARRVEGAQIMALAEAGRQPQEIADALGLAVATARTWIKRFNAAGLLGREDAPRSGASSRPTMMRSARRAGSR